MATTINFDPTRDWVVLPVIDSEKTESGIILPESVQKTIKTNILPVKGTVTISITDYDSLRGAQDSALKKDEGLTRAAKELEVFLSFLITRENIVEYLDEFNRQSKGTKINLIEGRAKIIFKDEKN